MYIDIYLYKCIYIHTYIQVYTYVYKYTYTYTYIYMFTEINNALGQAVLAIAIIAERAHIEFKKYGLIPMGSYPKIYKVEDRRTLYCLYTDGSFSLFPKRKFNLALVGFLHCVKELGNCMTMYMYIWI
jgi:hypothetical protein